MQNVNSNKKRPTRKITTRQSGLVVVVTLPKGVVAAMAECNHRQKRTNSLDSWVFSFMTSLTIGIQSTIISTTLLIHTITLFLGDPWPPHERIRAANLRTMADVI